MSQIEHGIGTHYLIVPLTMCCRMLKTPIKSRSDGLPGWMASQVYDKWRNKRWLTVAASIATSFFSPTEVRLRQARDV